MRLWLLDQVADVQTSLEGLVRVMVERADKERDILLPGYTHLQVTCPSLSFVCLNVCVLIGCGHVARSTDPLVPLFTLTCVLVQK